MNGRKPFKRRKHFASTIRGFCQEVCMEKEKISIIIPVYKVEKYLPKCLNSVIHQTYKNLEILLIDDGSPDSCGEICDKFAEKDSRIRVIHKENAGVAMARNDGIEAATGDYISFIDSDDWIAKDAYEILYQGIKEYDADCAIGRCVTVIDEDGVLTPKTDNSTFSEGCHQASDIMKHTLLKGSAVWNRLFKRQIFKSIRFPVGRINDDEVAALRAYAKCQRIVSLNHNSYYYRIRPDSITTSRFTLRNMDCYYNSRDNLAFIKNVRPELTKCAEFKTYKTLLYCYLHLGELKGEPEADRLKKKLHAEIHRVRSAAYRNPYVTLPMKLAFVYGSIF